MLETVRLDRSATSVGSTVLDLMCVILICWTKAIALNAPLSSVG